MLDHIRPGLAERAAEDAAWLDRLPRILRSVVLPGLAIAVPVAFAVPHALAPSGRPVDEITFTMLDVYIESIPFMVIAAIIGLTAPTLGVLFLASHMVADLGAAFIQPLELTPLPIALAGRLVSFWLLYLLVAELPMAVHDLTGSAGWRRAGVAGGLLRVVVGTAAGAFFAGVWGFGATLLVRPVFTWSDLNLPTANAGWPLLSTAVPFAVVVGAGAFVVLALRYLLLPAPPQPEPAADQRGPGSLGKLVFGVVVPLALLSSVITQPVDAIVLVVAVLGARPISALVLRRARLARPLAAIPRPLRLIGGVALSAGVSYLIVSVLGVSTLSRFFTMVVAMGVSYVLVRTLLDADNLTPSSADAGPSLAAGIGASLTIGVMFWLFGAGPVLADNIIGQTDGWGEAAAAAGAAAGAGGLAASSANKNKNKKKPNPPPWYVPDFSADFFGYDPPPPPPDTKKKQPDWTKPNPPPPGGPDY
jgi:hypothetical protein